MTESSRGSSRSCFLVWLSQCPRISFSRPFWGMLSCMNNKPIISFKVAVVVSLTSAIAIEVMGSWSEICAQILCCRKKGYHSQPPSWISLSFILIVTLIVLVSVSSRLKDASKKTRDSYGSSSRSRMKFFSSSSQPTTALTPLSSSLKVCGKQEEISSKGTPDWLKFSLLRLILTD